MSNEMVEKKEGALVTMADMAKYSGAGMEGMTAKDVAIPFTSIIQSLSPQRKKGHAKYIQGCEDGDIFNNVTGAIIKGSIRVVPCAYQKKYVEWKTRESGGGFVQQHDSEDILKQTTRSENGKDMLSNDRHIVTTAYHYVIIIHPDGRLERTVISMTSTNLKQSRKWNSIMQSLMIEQGGQRFNPPSFSHIYKLTPVIQSKGDMSWFIWDIGGAELISDGNLFQMAVKFNKDIGAGVVKAAEPQDEEIVTEDHSKNANF